MKVKAIATEGKYLSKKALDSFHNPEEYFDLNLGEFYVVYGINIWDGLIHYLIYVTSHLGPYWTPSELFTIIDNRLPPEWFFRFYGYEKHAHPISLVNAVWGYNEIALDPVHYEGLIEREHNALDIFWKRKKEIDKYHES
jgi:hypothetical protein